jgi:hypothetical protein
MDPASTALKSARRRRHDLDLIRTAVVVGLIFYHTALIFTPVGFYVNNRPPSNVLTPFVFFAALFGMPLLFVVAGGGVWHSLRTRASGGFVGERLTRLLVPLVVGVVLLVPPQIWYALRAHGQDPGSYRQFLDRFFDVQVRLGLPPVVERADPHGLFELAHLWFLYYLLVYSLLLLPVFRLLRGDAGQRLVEWLLARCRRPWGIAIFALPVAVVEAAFGTWGPGGWNRYAYVPFLLYGFLMAADARLRVAIRDRWKQAAAIGTVVLVALFVIAHYDLGGSDRVLGWDYDRWSVAWRLLKAVGGWLWTVAMFGFAAFLVGQVRRWTTAPGAAGPDPPLDPDRAQRTDHAVSYAREAVLPFYVLHQTPIVIIGFYVVQWEVGVLPKYLAISLASLAVTLVVYDLCVRRAAITRVLFGMPPSPRDQRR